MTEAGATCLRCGDALRLADAPVAGIPVCLGCIERGRGRFHPDSRPRPPRWILMRRAGVLLGAPLALGALVTPVAWLMLRRLTPAGTDTTSSALGAGLAAAGLAFLALATIWICEIRRLGNAGWRDELTEQLGLAPLLPELDLAAHLAFLDFSGRRRRAALEHGELGLMLVNAAGFVFLSASSEGLEAVRARDLTALEWVAPTLTRQTPRLRLRLAEDSLTEPALGRDRSLDFLARSDDESDALRPSFPLAPITEATG